MQIAHFIVFCTYIVQPRRAREPSKSECSPFSVISGCARETLISKFKMAEALSLLFGLLFHDTQRLGRLGIIKGQGQASVLVFSIMG